MYGKAALQCAFPFVAINRAGPLVTESQAVCYKKDVFYDM